MQNVSTWPCDKWSGLSWDHDPVVVYYWSESRMTAVPVTWTTNCQSNYCVLSDCKVGCNFMGVTDQVPALRGMWLHQLTHSSGRTLCPLSLIHDLRLSTTCLCISWREIGLSGQSQEKIRQVDQVDPSILLEWVNGIGLPPSHWTITWLYWSSGEECFYHIQLHSAW